MPDAPYRLIFDIARDGGDGWISVWILAIIAVLTWILFAVLIVVMIKRGWRVGKGFAAFFAGAALFIALGTTAGAFQYGARQRGLETALAAGQAKTVEGCLDYYYPEPPHGNRRTNYNELWSVKGVKFSYTVGDMGSNFHNSAVSNGPVHADNRVRVSYVYDPEYRTNSIVRLEVADAACPPARILEF